MEKLEHENRENQFKNFFSTEEKKKKTGKQINTSSSLRLLDKPVFAA